MIENLDLLNPKKKYTCKGFEIIPSDYWVEEFLQSLKSNNQEALANAAQFELWFVPVVNPDGLNYVFTHSVALALMAKIVIL